MGVGLANGNIVAVTLGVIVGDGARVRLPTREDRPSTPKSAWRVSRGPNVTVTPSAVPGGVVA